MNAAFLLVTTAWFAGQTAAPPPPPYAGPAPVVNGSYDSCCDSGGHGHRGGGGGFLSGMRGRFGHNRNNCGCDGGTTRMHGHRGSSCDSGCAPAAPAASNTCDSGCGGGHHGRSGGGFLSGMRGRFGHNRNNCGCDGGCDSGCGSSAAGMPAPVGPVGPGAEPIPVQPKKMPATAPERVPAPKAKPAPNGREEVRFNNTPALTPATQAAPSIEVAPPAAPAINDTRAPF